MKWSYPWEAAPEDKRTEANLSDQNLKWFNFSATPDPFFVLLAMFQRGRSPDPLHTRPIERLGCMWRSAGCVSFELICPDQNDISAFRILFDAGGGTAKQTWYELGPQYLLDEGANPARQYGGYSNAPGLGSQQLTRHRE